MGPTDRVVVLIDMDCFYCQVEEQLNPKLQGQPIAVVQYNAWRGGGIIAVNYPARDQGVTRHMRGYDAKKKCPSINLVQVPELRGKADLTKYREAGKRVADVLATFTAILERASVDEAYLDITEIVNKKIEDGLSDLTLNNMANTFIVGCNTEDFIELAKTNRDFTDDNLKLAIGGLITEQIRREVYEKTGYKCSAGIAHNKILAKLVCSLHKPNKQTVLPQEEVAAFFEKMPINKIKSLGGKFGQTLSEDLAITYMGQLAKFTQRELMQKYDEKTANWLYNIARGINYDPVTTKLISKSIACCKNFPGKTALVTVADVQHWLKELSEELAERLNKDLKENNRKSKQIIVSFAQQINGKDVHSSRTNALTSYESKKIAQSAFDVINKFCLKPDGSYHLKFLGISAGHFEDVKNVREITSFFKKGQANSTHVKDEEEEDVYAQLTLEGEENLENVEYYDDSYRIKQNDSASFFAKYFEKQPQISVNEDSSIPQPSKESQEIHETCPECKKKVPISEFLSHQDYHFALNLVSNESKSQKSSPKDNNCTELKTKKRLKRKSNDACKNQDLKAFFKKNQVEDPFTPSETCPDCGKKIKLEEIDSHKDYHAAKRLHAEINAVKVVPSAPKRSKLTSKNHKNNNIKSVASYFKPI